MKHCKHRRHALSFEPGPALPRGQMTAETIVDTSAVLEVQRGLHKLKSGDFSGALKHSVSALELCSTPHEVYEASM